MLQQVEDGPVIERIRDHAVAETLHARQQSINATVAEASSDE